MSTAIAKQQSDQFADLVRRMRARISAVLPKHLTPDRMMKLILVEGSRNPDIWQCTASSVAQTIMLAAELGLQPSSPLGHFYLIPRRVKVDPRNKSRNAPREWQLHSLIGYKGLAELARRSRAISRLSAGVVYQAEIDAGDFTFTREPPSIQHAGTLGIERSDDTLMAAYAVAELVDGQRYQEVLDRVEIDRRRGRAQTQAIWRSDFAAMARKSAIRALLSGGLVPLSSELSQAVEVERIHTQVEVEPEEAEEVSQPAAGGPDELRALIGLVEEPAPAPEDTQAPEPTEEDPERLSVLASIREWEPELSGDGVAEAAKIAEISDGAALESLPMDQLRRYLDELRSRGGDS